MFKEFDVVALKREVPEIPVSTSGTVLMIYPESPVHYEVEFSDGKGGGTRKLTQFPKNSASHRHTLGLRRLVCFVRI